MATCTPNRSVTAHRQTAAGLRLLHARSHLRRNLACCVPWILLAVASTPLAAADPLFDLPALLAPPLNSRLLKRSEREGIVTEEVRFHSERDGEKEVDLFAYFSYPRGAVNLPAYIWNPGGLGQASPAFTEHGARHGYAVLCIDFPQPGYRSSGNYPINTGLFLGSDPKQAPIYHGAVALLRAVSYLESRPEVDKDRIGMAGSSWGGFFTTLMVGIDPRLKAGASLYGAGNLQLGNAWWDGDARSGNAVPSAERERWRITLDPAWRLPDRKTPIGWFTGTNDKFYFLSGVMKSYEMAGGPRHLTLLPNWDHALPTILTDELFLAWLDVHLRGKGALPTVTALTLANEAGRLVARWTFSGEAAGADLIASYGEPGNWVGRFWHTFPAEITGNSCRAEFPPGKLPCLISGAVVTQNGLRTSTPILTVDAHPLGLKPEISVPDYDGCREWGGFEESHIAYLDRHTRSGQTRWLPKLSRDARRGTHAAFLEPGQTVLPPILSTATIPHRFSCWLKGDKPTNVTVQLGIDRQTFAVGGVWTEIELRHTPPVDLKGGLAATITIPADATVLIDSIEFHPIGR